MSTATRVLQALRSLFGRKAPPVDVDVGVGGRVAEQSSAQSKPVEPAFSSGLPASQNLAKEAARVGVRPSPVRNQEQHVKLADTSEAKKSAIDVSSSLRTVRPHIPLIKFRKGGRSVETPVAAAPPVTDIADEDMFRSSVAAAAAEVKASTSTLSASSPWRAVQKGPIEFYELPEKYRRRPIDELECDIINMGGRDKPFE